MAIQHDAVGFLALYGAQSTERPSALALFALGRPALSRGELMRQTDEDHG